MKKYARGLVPSLFIFGIMFSACQKSINETRTNVSIENEVKSDNGNTIRLTSVSSEFGSEYFTYNADGLLDTWTSTQIGARVQHEYDENGRLIRSWVYFNDVLTYRIDFFYDKNRIVREVWYDGNTSNIVDDVSYFFEHNVPTHAISEVANYRIDYKFTPQGNLQEYVYSVNGIPVAKGIYTYDHHIKSPYSAIPGMPYYYLFANGFFYTNKWYSTSETFILYDAEGNVLQEILQDPLKNVVEAGPQHYVAKSDFYDITSGEFIHFVFSYENCGACENHKEVMSKSGQKSTRQLLQELMVKGSKKSIMARVEKLRENIRN